MKFPNRERTRVRVYRRKEAAMGKRNGSASVDSTEIFLCVNKPGN